MTKSSKRSSCGKSGTQSRIKVPHIGPRPRSTRPGVKIEDEKEKERKQQVTKRTRKK